MSDAAYPTYEWAVKPTRLTPSVDRPGPWSSAPRFTVSGPACADPMPRASAPSVLPVASSFFHTLCFTLIVMSFRDDGDLGRGRRSSVGSRRGVLLGALARARLGAYRSEDVVDQ